jgi:hypothetical protein
MSQPGYTQQTMGDAILQMQQVLAQMMQRSMQMGGGGMGGGRGAGTLLHKNIFEPILKPGFVVRIEPLHKYGFFRVPRSHVIETMFAKTVNIATPFTQQIPAWSNSSTNAGFERKVSDLNMEGLQLAHLRLLARDPWIQFTVKQPGSFAKHRNKDGPLSFDKGFTDMAWNAQLFSLLPELFIFEDQTEPKIGAINLDSEEATYQARFIAIGFRYPLEPIRATEEQTALTISVEAK